LILWGSNFWLSHRNEKSPLTQGLNYRSACDSHERNIYPQQTVIYITAPYAPNVTIKEEISVPNAKRLLRTGMTFVQSINQLLSAF